MNRKKRLGLAIIWVPSIIIILILGAVYLGFVQQSAFYDDFLIEDDFTIPDASLSLSKNVYTNGCILDNDQYCNINIYNTSKWRLEQNQVTCAIGVPQGRPDSYSQYEKDAYVFAGYGSSYTKITYMKNLKNKDIKMSLKFDGGKTCYGKSCIGGGSFKLFFNNKVAYSDSANMGTSKDYFLEIYKDITNPDIFHIFINGEEKSSILILESELYISLISSGGSCGSMAYTGTLTIDNLKSRPYFNCKIDTDEVVVRDGFLENTQFNINDLAYEPKKFCVDVYPIVKRSFTEKGSRSDIMGQLTKMLVTGENIIVGTDEEIDVYYIVDYKEGMGERCEVNSVYEVLTKKCVENVNEEEDIIEVVNTKEFIHVGKDQYYFEDNTTIGINNIFSSSPSYLCTDEKATASTPNPRPDCWSGTVTYKNQNYLLIYGEDKDIDEFFKLQYFPSASYTKKGINQEYTNNFILTLKNRNLFNIERTSYEKNNYFQLFKSEYPIYLKITNNYDDFEKTGIYITKTRELLTSQISEQITIPFIKGANNYELMLDTTQYGIINYEIVPYFYIGNEIFFDDEKIRFNFEIVDKIPSNITIIENVVVIEKNVTTELTIFKNKVVKLINYVSYLIIIAVIISIIVIVYYKKR